MWDMGSEIQNEQISYLDPGSRIPNTAQNCNICIKDPYNLPFSMRILLLNPGSDTDLQNFPYF
jgi:hypothetical protein